MADYFPLIARAVSALEKSTGEVRRAIYERARTALITQLRSVQPALSESDITRERLGLEEAIRRVENEAARRVRDEAAKARGFGTPSGPPGGPSRKTASNGGADHVAAVTPQSPQGANDVRKDKTDDGAPLSSDEQKRGRDTPSPQAGDRSQPHPQNGGEKDGPAANRPQLSDKALHGFRHVIAEAEQLGDGAAEESKSLRGAYASVPAPSSDTERLEPRFEAGSRHPGEDDRESGARKNAPAAAPKDKAPGRSTFGSTSDPGTAGAEAYAAKPMRVGSGNGRRVLVFLAILAVLGGLAALVYGQRGAIVAFFDSFRPPATQTARETPANPAQRPKIPDRIGQEAGVGGSSGMTTAVAQRVVLFEQIPNSAEKKQSVGSVIWRTEMSSSGPKQPPVMTIKADVEIPERHLRMSWSMRRNTDPALPASHTIEIIFNGSADFPANSVTNVPGILMDVPEQNRGVPLAGLAVKVTNGFFLIGLSAVDVDVQRNTQLLKDRPWLDIPIVYVDGGRALLAMEKGTPGDRVFAEAFAAWAQK